MSLRCSLLGHEYGEIEIERDREERGNEVVISVVELERCTRCGTTRTISENTEVTQLSRARSNVEPGPASPQPAPNSSAGTGTGPGIEPRSDVAPGNEPEIESRPEADARTESGANRGSTTDGQSGSGMGFGVDADSDPAAEDTEIMDDTADDREPGAWPETDDVGGTATGSSAGWPSVEGEDEGFDADVPDGKTDLEFGGGLTPQADQGAEIIEGDGEGGGENEAPTFVSAGPTPAPDRPTGADAGTTLYCPNCRTRGLEERDSLRAGDICPECHRGYLAGGEP